jgi:hypothetical protein
MRDRRCDVIRAHWEIAVRLSGETIESLAARAVDIYQQRTPLHARGIEFQPLGRDPYLALRANALHVRRFMGVSSPSVRMPAELEEAMVLALPEPFKRECLKELAERYGLLASRAPQPDGRVWDGPADLMRECAEALRALAPALVDGKLGREDAAELRACMRHLDEVHSAAHSLMAQLSDVLDDKPKVVHAQDYRATVSALRVSEVDPS